ncbi:DUF192 domain-containing protein [Amaricoccus sp.]|uniref:DUF192 domain-containing protein n=1 Tax=Amaricoccus sp. TaxID=1872485 RepID=UPI001B484F4C|nr:DUF192 domain-containing protein [Amaricoccus sp.]MBP7241193.1 DUF192 domain-containing protein [Amaricoccus sp.]
MRPDGRARIAGALLLAICAGPVAAACASDVVELRQGASVMRFQVEVADDEAERARGLMFRESLPRFGGMLFVYETPQPVAFWMKNTLIPLDMLFFDAAGRLAALHENAVPGDLTPISGGPAPVQFVLELAGGSAARLGVAPGAEMRHPAVAADAAAWSCEAG